MNLQVDFDGAAFSAHLLLPQATWALLYILCSDMPLLMHDTDSRKPLHADLYRLTRLNPGAPHYWQPAYLSRDALTRCAPSSLLWTLAAAAAGGSGHNSLLLFGPERQPAAYVTAIAGGPSSPGPVFLPNLATMSSWS